MFINIILIFVSFSAYKIQVDEAGIYKLDKPFLDNAGVNLAGIDPKTIKIFNKGMEISIYVYGEEDSVFDSTDYIEFYGTRDTSQYTTENVYWFSCGGSIGLRMLERYGTPVDSLPVPNCFMDSVHFEENIWYCYAYYPHGEDHWFWRYISAPGSQDFPFDLLNVSDTIADASLYIYLVGASNNNHHALVSLNGNLLIDTIWSGYEKGIGNINIPQSLLQQNNILQIQSPGDMGSETIYINYFGIRYWRNYKANNDVLKFCGSSILDSMEFRIRGFTGNNIVLFDITEERTPIRITEFITQPDTSGYTLIFQSQNGEYLALTTNERKYPQSMMIDESSDLHSSSNGADYIIITDKDFHNSILPLAVLRESQGMRVEIIKVQDIYDEFSYGIFNPDAIKYFLEYAYFNWQSPSPAYVLLVGDASYDYKNYLGVSKNYIPTHLFESSYYRMEVASDNWFVCVTGSDVLPDMSIGRLPARTIADANIMANKILEFESNLPDGEWKKTALFVADNPDKGNYEETILDSMVPSIPIDCFFAGDYEKASDSVASSVPEDYTIKKVYLSEYASPDSATSDIISYIDTGCVITNYFGHSSIDYWANEKIFESSDIHLLNNGDKLPLVNIMGCLSGFFHHATDEYCMAEEFLVTEGKGAIACFSPSGFGWMSHMITLDKALMDAFFQDGKITIGAAITQAKIELFNQYPGHLDQIEMFNLLGDPALRMPFETGIENRKMEIGKWKLVVYPNPFSQKIVIRYKVGEQSHCHHDTLSPTLKVYDLCGRLIYTLPITDHLSSNTEIVWDGCNNNGKRVKNGVYFARFESGDFKVIHKLVLIR